MKANTNSTREDDKQGNNCARKCEARRFVVWPSVHPSSFSAHPQPVAMVSANGTGFWLAGGDGRGQTSSVLEACWGVGDVCGSEVDWGTGEDNGELMC